MTTYPISLPTGSTVQPKETTFRIVRQVASSSSAFTGAQQVYMYQGEWWEAEIQLPPMRGASARAWIATLVSMRGIYGQMYLGDWDGRTPNGTASGTPLVKGASQTGNSLITDGWGASVTGIMKAGDYIQLGSGISQRLHMVVADANSDGSGDCTLSIEPALRVSPADNLAITTSSPKGVFRLSSNDTEWNANAVSTYGLVFAVKEYLASTT